MNQNQQNQQEQEQKSQLNFQLGHIKANTNSFWLAIVFLIVLAICFINWMFCNTLIKITDQYFKNLTEISLKIDHK